MQNASLIVRLECEREDEELYYFFYFLFAFAASGMTMETLNPDCLHLCLRPKVLVAAIRSLFNANAMG